MKTAVLKKLCVLMFLLCVATSSFSQIVPYYPIEIFFSPLGYTNQLPGCNPDLYTTQSSLKIVLNKDLPSTERVNNTITILGNLDFIHSLNNARDYFPFMINPALRTHFFANDIFTLGLDINGNVENSPGIKKNLRVFRSVNYRLRIRPFLYQIISPNLIFHQMLTYGVSKFDEKTGVEGKITTKVDTFKVNNANGMETDSIEIVKSASTEIFMVYRDYNVYKYEAKFIYFTPFHTRIFFVPFVFYNQYKDLPARDSSGVTDPTNIKLRETGGGFALGLRYSTFSWGFTEAAFEYERNVDLIHAANSYTKYKLSTKWENQYFTQRFGYMLMFNWIKHVSDNFATGFPEESNISGVLGQVEINLDVMPIINLNRNVSLRPDFYFIYKDLPSSGEETIKGREDIKKFRYSLHLHILL